MQVRESESIHLYIAKNMSERTATVERKTSETEISCTINLDHDPSVGKQVIEVNTGLGFLDHVYLPHLPVGMKLIRARCLPLWQNMEG